MDHVYLINMLEDPETSYRLHDFPKGYKLFRSYVLAEAKDRPKMIRKRTDCYLHGMNLKCFAS